MYWCCKVSIFLSRVSKRLSNAVRVRPMFSIGKRSAVVGSFMEVFSLGVIVVLGRIGLSGADVDITVGREEEVLWVVG
jgi:hypothetical protein